MVEIKGLNENGATALGTQETADRRTSGALQTVYDGKVAGTGLDAARNFEDYLNQTVTMVEELDLRRSVNFDPVKDGIEREAPLKELKTADLP